LRHIGIKMTGKDLSILDDGAGWICDPAAKAGAMDCFLRNGGKNGRYNGEMPQNAKHKLSPGDIGTREYTRLDAGRIGLELGQESGRAALLRGPRL